MAQSAQHIESAETLPTPQLLVSPNLQVVKNTKNLVTVGWVFLIVGIFFILYYSLRQSYGMQDIFLTPLSISQPGTITEDLDCWSLLHIGLFAFLTYKIPEYWPLWLALGILWEYWEDLLGILMEKPQSGTHWWYGRWSDIIMNIIGILIGLGLARAAGKI